MTQRLRWILLAFMIAGAVGAVLLFSTFKHPCGGLLRMYAVAYDRAKGCTADADCIVDPFPTLGPGLCDRTRARSSSHDEMERVERAWAEASCPAPGEPCPAVAGVRCARGRCESALR